MILISSGGGNVGQHVVAQLVAKKVTTRAGFHSKDKASALQTSGMEGIALDFDDPDTIASAFDGVTKLFLASPGSPQQGRQEENLIVAAKNAGVELIVKLSGRISEGIHTGFALWNSEAEQRIKASGISYTILRSNYFMQNLLGNAAQIKQGAFSMGPAARRIAYIDTRDIAAMAVAVLTEEGHVGESYDLNGPQLLSGEEQAAIISDILEQPVRYLDMSIAEFTGQLKNYGMPTWLVEAFGAALATPVPPDQSSADIERVLHREPGSFEQFIRDYRTAFQAND